MTKYILTFSGDMTSTFVIRDYEMLKKDYTMNLVPLPRDDNKIVRYIRNVIYIPKLLLALKESEILFTEFASWHSAIGVLWCKLLHKKSAIVIGGYDAAYLPELKYGLFANPFTAIFARLCYNNGDSFLVVEKSLGDDICKNMKKEIQNIYYIPRGHDHNIFTPGEHKYNVVLTVAKGNYINRCKLKGVDTFVKAAKAFPDTQFIVVGMDGAAKDYLKTISPDNVLFIGKLPQKELLPFYRGAKIYCQLSKREGIPNVLCEAMLCECIPIGTRIPGIKTAIGDTGFYVDYGDVDQTITAIEMAFEDCNDRGHWARQRIMYELSDAQRIMKIDQVIAKLKWGGIW